MKDFFTNPFYIVGAGGCGKEILFLLEDLAHLSHQIEFRGFVDFNAGNLLLGNTAHPIFEEEVFLRQNRHEEINILFGIGDARQQEAAKHKYTSPNFHFPNLIHPSVIQHRESITMREGNVVCAGVIIEPNVQLGSFNIINARSIICHDSQIGSHNVISPAACITGGVRIADKCFIGAQATVLQNLSIDSGAIVGAGSVVTRDIPANTVVFGNPAKNIRPV
ncbi:MAG: NeuD/PglB/VioB family sugar acetyltransferase [Saprospiraceae bacterium]|nr:NeuD/PglB/VioB family sugar acetyltransferase [Saprospiraceae bacterium]